MGRCFHCFRQFNTVLNLCPYCGKPTVTAPKSPVQLAPGTVLANRYVLGLAVGSGGFGIVYKAYDTKLETVVAVKEFFSLNTMTRAAGLRNVIVSKKSEEEFKYRKERFLAEARNMAMFSSHRSIPHVLEYFEENNTAYIVMELLEGCPLNEYMHSNGEKLDVDLALMITNEVGNALSALHEKGVIHRDVAPDNIFICGGAEIRIKLMDLGAAKLADTTDDVVDIILKPGYSPCEQYNEGKDIGTWTDVYALGATLYAMVTGIKPDESTNRKIEDTVIPPYELDPSISENLSNAIMKAMAIDRHMRFKSVAEFLRAINGEKKVTSLKKERLKKRIKRALIVIAAMAVVAVGLGVALKTYNERIKSELLKPATITIWYPTEAGAGKDGCLEAVRNDFEKEFEGVILELVGIDSKEYEDTIKEAALKGQLPTLFESTGLSDETLKLARSLDNVIGSDEFNDCLFLNQYYDHYSNKKQLPLGINLPVVVIISKGDVSVPNATEFTSVSDLKEIGSGLTYSIDKPYQNLIRKNFNLLSYAQVSTFGTTSEVILTTTLNVGNIATYFEGTTKCPAMICLAYVAEDIYFDFTYEWSLGDGNTDEILAAEMLLRYFLGERGQEFLCNDGAIVPVNEKIFKNWVSQKKNSNANKNPDIRNLATYGDYLKQMKVISK